ncbi:MAG: hypothetical protein AB8G99_09250 [Planctomycetaceae bacterium]
MKAAATGERRRYRGLVLIVLLSVAGVVAIAHSGLTPIGGSPARNISAVILFGNVAAYVWVRTHSRFGRSGQVATVAVVLLLQLGVRAAIRIDGFMGDGRPIVVWSWKPTAEEVFASKHRPHARTPEHLPLGDSLLRADWLGFRNEDRSGRGKGKLVIRDFESEAPTELWRRPVGRGWSSFVVVGDRCVTQEQRGELEAVVCYHVLTGEELWAHTDEAAFREITCGDGPRATPASDGNRVITLGATGLLNCLNLEDGTRNWECPTLQAATRRTGVWIGRLSVDRR